jgi:hypothetical protein
MMLPMKVAAHRSLIRLISCALGFRPDEGKANHSATIKIAHICTLSKSTRGVSQGYEAATTPRLTHALCGSGRTLHDAPDHHGRNAREHGLSLRGRQYTAKNVPELTGLLM